MTAQSLYNKWRAQTFQEILGQEHITRTLQNQIKAGRIGHAYLFTGARGTGKTSTARILAKAVNCVGDTDNPPCNRCHICRSITEGTSLDLIEIDAASNRGIDEIRELRDRVAFAPHECRYKVYVIDEVHMLTNEAFNALLKTLEEPPKHVIFVLCTTEPHRLPDTILSRCQRFDFRRGTVPIIAQKLRYICDQEGIAIAPEALEYIARRAEGSFRDAESLLDQLAAYGAEEITLELVQNVLGLAPSAMVIQVIQSLLSGHTAEGLRAINQAIDQGAEPRQLLSEILDHLRALLLLRVGGQENIRGLEPQTLEALQELAQRHASLPLGFFVQALKRFNEAGRGLREAVLPQLPLELALIESSQPQGEPSPSAREALPQEEPAPAAKESPAPSRQPREQATTEAEPSAPVPQEAEAATAPSPEEQQKEESSPPSTAQAPQEKAEPPTQEEPLSLEEVRHNWGLVLTKVRPRSPQVRALLVSAYPVATEGDTIILGCEASFHRDKLSEEERRSLVERTLSEVLKRPVHIQCIVDPRVLDKLQTRISPPPSNEALFSPREETSDSQERLRKELLNHPAVKALEKKGGRVDQVTIYEQEEEVKPWPAKEKGG